MFGGPWLGLLVFVFIAIALGWGFSKLFQGMLEQTTQQLGAGELDHSFEPDTIYTLRQDLVLGYTSNGVQTLFPDRDALPRNAPGRRSMPSADEVRGMTTEELKARDLRGVVERSTRVRFVEVIDDRDNAQTRVLVKVELLDGPYASPTPVLGMHLESADTDEETEATRYLPRADLFEPAPGPVQSSVPAP